MSKNRNDHNSLSGQLEAFGNAMARIEPPAHITLRDCDWPFWYGIVSTRAANSWNDSDLAKAANLARCQADIERLIAEVQIEGDIIVNDRGTPIVNPKHNLIETMSRREVAISRAIHVHAEATVGRSRDSGNRAKAQKEARGILEGSYGDPFLAQAKH